MSVCKGISSLLIVGLFPIGVWAQETVSLETFLTMSPQELETSQVKLTYLGPQEKLIPTIIFTIHGHPVNWEAFEPWDDPEQNVNDALYREHQKSEPSFTVSVEELRAMIEALSDYAKISAITDEGPQWLSVTITAGPPGGVQGAETLLGSRKAQEWFTVMQQSLHADPKDITLMEGGANLDAMRTLQWWGCALGLLPEEIPAKDVTALTHVTIGGLRLNPQTKQFEGTATITNTSKKAIRGPIALVVDLSANVSLSNAHGTTCVTSPVGREFINLPMPTETLEPGASLETVLEFERDQLTEIRFTTKVLAGPGER